MVDIPVQQAKPAEQRPPLDDTTVIMIHDTTTFSPTQPPQTQPKRSKIKRILKKSKKLDTQVDTSELESRVTRLEKTVTAMSIFNLLDEIDKSIKAHLKNILPKDLPDFGKIKLEKATKKSLPKESKACNKHPTHKALYDALAISLSVDEDDMDKQLADLPVQKKRRRDDQDQDPPRESEKKRKRKDVDKSSSKKGEPQSKSSKSTKAPHVSSPTKKAVDVTSVLQIVLQHQLDETDVDMAIDDVQADDVQEDVTTPTQDRSKWFKEDVDVRPKTPGLEWREELNDVPEQSWFNDKVNAQKGPVTFDDIMGSVVDFTNFAKNYLQKDKITKSDLEGLAFKLLKGKYKNYIELEYNFEECYRALTDQTDWINPEGERITYDLSKPLSLQGPPGRTTIPVNFFFNKYLEYLKNGSTKRRHASSLTKPRGHGMGLRGWKICFPEYLA
ncbi:hypothetical protein Tco_0963223 [Tanacetum coccineum]